MPAKLLNAQKPYVAAPPFDETLVFSARAGDSKPSENSGIAPWEMLTASTRIELSPDGPPPVRLKRMLWSPD